jgi:hypothetical protein
MRTLSLLLISAISLASSPAFAVTIFSESFNGFTAPAENFDGVQFQSGLGVAFSGDLPGWTKSGLHSVHVVDSAIAPSPSDFAVMLILDNVITLNTAISGSNNSGTEYEVSFLVSPAVYMGQEQATSSSDGLVIEIVRNDNSVLASNTHLPGVWTGDFSLLPASFQYTGDDSGDIRLRVSSLNFGDLRFGGAIDNIVLEAIPDPATYTDTVLSDAPVAYWRLNETTGPFIDEIGGRVGTQVQGSITTGEPGAIVGDPDTAIRSGASGGTISVPYDPAMNALTFTLETWVKYGSNCTDGNVGGNHCNIAGSTATSLILFGTASGPAMPHLFVVRNSTSSPTNQCTLLGTDVILGETYHVVGTYDGTTGSLYVNGQLEDAQSPCDFASQATAFELFGSGGKRAENVTLDEVAYYDYALPADRVLAHYQLGTNSVPPACLSPGSFTPSTASLAASQDNYCEDWFGISQPGENLQDALLTWTDLTNANFAGSLLFNVDFTNALLTNASLFNARFGGAILSSADLTGADLSFATMTGAFYDESTVFPSGNTYETAPTGLDGDQRPWEAGMIPVPEPGFGITLLIGSGLIGMSLRRRATSKTL